MEKEIAKINIFNSIFQSIKDSGFKGLQSTLEIIPVNNNELNNFFDLKNNNSDYIYFNSFGTVPDEYTFKLAGISGNFNEDNQKEWFKNYIKTPNKYVKYVLSTYVNKLSMNSKLKNKLDFEFLDCITKAINMDIKDINVNDNYAFNQSFTNEEFQDLLFITCAETIYNPEIEETISENFNASNSLFWKRFNELYKTAFKAKFGESNIINDSFLLNEQINKQKKLLGFEIIEESMINKKFPIYSNKFQFYLQFKDDAFKNREREYEEYKDFRQKEFSLYNDLCDKYNINPIRTKMI